MVKTEHQINELENLVEIFIQDVSPGAQRWKLWKKKISDKNINAEASKHS